MACGDLLVVGLQRVELGRGRSLLLAHLLLLLDLLAKAVTGIVGGGHGRDDGARHEAGGHRDRDAS